MIKTCISLQMPSDIGAIVAASDNVQQALHKNPIAGVISTSTPEDNAGTLRDLGATTVAILGTAAAVTAVRGLFDVLKIAIAEAYKTRRQRLTEEHEERMLKLIMDGQKTLEINLDSELKDIIAQIDEAEEGVISTMRDMR